MDVITSRVEYSVDWTIHQARPDLTVVFKNYDDDDNDNNSLRGRRLKGKWKGDLGARETRGARGAPLAPKTPFPFPFKRAFPSRPKPPFPSLSNACQAGYDNNDNDDGW